MREEIINNRPAQTSRLSCHDAAQNEQNNASLHTTPKTNYEPNYAPAKKVKPKYKMSIPLVFTYTNTNTNPIRSMPP